MSFKSVRRRLGLYLFLRFVRVRFHVLGCPLRLTNLPRNIGRPALPASELATGLVGAPLLTRFISSMLVGIGTHNPLTFAGIALVLAAVGALACFLPARRAARVDPMVALRAE